MHHLYWNYFSIFILNFIILFIQHFIIIGPWKFSLIYSFTVLSIHSFSILFFRACVFFWLPLPPPDTHHSNLKQLFSEMQVLLIHLFFCIDIVPVLIKCVLFCLSRFLILFKWCCFIETELNCFFLSNSELCYESSHCYIHSSIILMTLKVFNWNHFHPYLTRCTNLSTQTTSISILICILLQSMNIVDYAQRGTGARSKDMHIFKLTKYNLDSHQQFVKLSMFLFCHQALVSSNFLIFATSTDVVLFSCVVLFYITNGEINLGISSYVSFLISFLFS